MLKQAIASFVLSIESANNSLPFLIVVKAMRQSVPICNDTYGHLAGDLCLQKVAKVMSAVVGQEPTAIVARYGGEEFAAILVNLSDSRAIEIAEQMRTSVLQLNIPHAKSKATDRVTLSIGICSLIPQSHLCERDLIARADEHLYQAKADGRNRVVAELSAIDNSLPDMET
jgi:diguanylate cyclase (GGDEF)-like protein